MKIKKAIKIFKEKKGITPNSAAACCCCCCASIHTHPAGESEEKE